MNDCYVIAYDIGTTGNKSCLYRLSRGEGGAGISLAAEAGRRYALTLLEGGGAEQEPLDWWRSMADTTRELLAAASITAGDVKAVSFCSQMQGLVLVDEQGNALRPAMSYMDRRAAAQHEAWCRGSPSVEGIALSKLLVSLSETGVAAASAKDPPFRYAWVREKEPDVFERVYKWLDVKDYLVFKATGRAAMTEDSAFATMLYNAKKKCWSAKVSALHGVRMSHLPEIIHSSDEVGRLTAAAAAELGLTQDCAVIAGGGDSSLLGVGAGAVRVGDTHMYIGTSGWVSTVTDKRLVDVAARIASSVGAIPGRYNYFAEMETSGKCIEWARDNLALDSLGLYAGAAPEDALDRMCRAAAGSKPGAGGVIFMPWLLGNRCPFEDALCQGGFFNIGLNTRKVDLVRAVLEGILLHKRWMLEKEAEKIPTSPTINIVGGGARSDIICQMLADITGRTVKRVKDPQNAGALGAALLMAAGLKYLDSLDAAGELVPVDRVFEPDAAAAPAYEKNYRVFKRLYTSNRVNFRMLNG